MQDNRSVEYGYTPQFLTRDGKPWMPTMGEFHYSRYPYRHWKRELAKMKAGGIDIVATYIFWIHHQETEECICFDSNLNLRRFVEDAAKAGLKVFLRIGPWAHGEARNGGFPDWIMNRSYTPRTNNPVYLEDVRCFYQAIFDQVDGLFHKQGGPIIGIQIENECGHAGGEHGDEGDAYMKSLIAMARTIGYDAPYWTATGWGGAVTGGLLPVMGGYTDAPWDRRISDIEPSTNFIFTSQRNDQAIACEYGPGNNITFDPALFPYLTAELGPGLQATAHRRPVPTPQDVEAMSICKLGSGASLLGYYMYHGGTNPVGVLSTFEENKSTGSPNDLPVFSYDFHAPLGEFGHVRDSYRHIRRLAMFLREFGEDLCRMQTTFPPGNPENPSNFHALRHTQRDNGVGGYLFVNNHQRRRVMADHHGKVLKAVAGGKHIVFPPRDILQGQYFFWPFHLQIGDAMLETATATPLCVLHTAMGAVPVFYSDYDPAYQWETPPQSGHVLTLSQVDSLLATKITCSDGEHLLLWDGIAYENEHGALLLERPGSKTLRIWPPLQEVPDGIVRVDDENEFAVYALPEKNAMVSVQCDKQASSSEGDTWIVMLGYSGEMQGAFLRVKGVYDVAKLYVDGHFIGDHFYNGEVWTLDMERYGYPEEIEIRLTPLRIDQRVYLDTWPELPEGKACILAPVEAEPIYTVTLA